MKFKKWPQLTTCLIHPIHSHFGIVISYQNVRFAKICRKNLFSNLSKKQTFLAHFCFLFRLKEKFIDAKLMDYSLAYQKSTVWVLFIFIHPNRFKNNDFFPKISLIKLFYHEPTEPVEYIFEIVMLGI